MSYFDDVLTEPARAALAAKANGRPVVGTTCLLTPLEIIRAAGAFPLRIDSGSAAADLRADEMPRDACPLTRACWGEYFAPSAAAEMASLLDAVVIPVTCDWHRSLADRVRERLPTFVLNVPRNKRAPGALEHWRNQVLGLSRSLQERYGAAMTAGALVEAINAYRQATVQVRRLIGQMRRERPPIAGTELLKALGALCWDAPDAWAIAAARLADTAEAARPDDGAEPRCRVALLGSPPIWPNFTVPRLIEESSAAIVADESCAGSRAFYDAVYIDDPSVAGMTRAVADRCLLPCSCPCLVPNDDRAFRLRALVEDCRPDGAVYLVLKSCFVYEAESEWVRALLQDQGVRTLPLESDYSSEATEQLRTRVETFVDMIAARRAAPRLRSGWPPGRRGRS